jgi:hypothetical protein
MIISALKPYNAGVFNDAVFCKYRNMLIVQYNNDTGYRPYAEHSMIPYTAHCTVVAGYTGRTGPQWHCPYNRRCAPRTEHQFITFKAIAQSIGEHSMITVKRYEFNRLYFSNLHYHGPPRSSRRSNAFKFIYNML